MDIQNDSFFCGSHAEPQDSLVKSFYLLIYEYMSVVRLLVGSLLLRAIFRFSYFVTLAWC